MKVFGDIKCIAMLMVSVTLMMIHPALWGVVPDAHKLDHLVHDWQCAGPHTTLAGKVREFLSTAWWLGPLKVGSSRDPLKECGISAALGWREMLPLMFDLKTRIACLEEQVLMADKEHKEFVWKFLLAVCCLVIVAVFGVLLTRWTWARFTLFRETKIKTSNKLLVYMGTVSDEGTASEQYYTLERCIIVVVYEIMTSDGLIIRKGKYIQFANDISNNTHVSSTLLALPSVEGAAKVVSQKEGDDKDATSVLRRSLYVLSRFRDRLWGSEEIHLTNLRNKYNVDVFTDTKRGKLHIKGSKDNVLVCYAAIRALLAAWRSWEDVSFTRYSPPRTVVTHHLVRSLFADVFNR